MLWLFELTALSPADLADSRRQTANSNYMFPADKAERMQQAALFRRERQLVVGMVLGFVCDYQRDQRETLGFIHVK